MSTTATATPAIKPVRKFVPVDIDLGNVDAVMPLYRKLLDRPIESTGDADRWLADFSELASAVDEYGSRRYIDKSCHTDDAEIEKRFMHVVEEIEPKLKPLFFELQKKFLASPVVSVMDQNRYGLLIKKWKTDVDLFRPENVAIDTDVSRVTNEYDKVSGAMMVTFEGAERTLQQMARFGEQTDRGLRERAWRASSERRMRDRGKIDGFFDQLLKLRRDIAKNAGLDNYRDVAWRQYKRFDYTPDQCLKFADAIEAVCVPVVRELDARRKRDLKIDKLRPWDRSVDPQNRPPLEPFGEKDATALIDKTKAIFDRLSPELAGQFETLRTNKNLDLESRKGKQPGGYQSSLEESRQPFIFMNAAGLQRDVETLLHEGGHAFHYLAAANEPLMFLRSAPMEFCEVASMSMELLGSEHFDMFYNADNAARARKTMLEGIVRFFPWMATIDTFQHWLYTHPNHTTAERTKQWITILDRFGGDVDWTGLEDAREASWQQQLHLFHAPFYYVEYGIAQTGAMQLWMKAQTDPQRALANYRAGIALGGKKSLPELFTATGLRFDFTEQTLKPLIAAVAEEL